jgi:hypothetical protein
MGEERGQGEGGRMIQTLHTHMNKRKKKKKKRGEWYEDPVDACYYNTSTEFRI